MSWGRMDDKFHRNRKVRALRRVKGGREALGVWVFWWSWCLDGADFDGVVPSFELDPVEEKSANLLVDHGLWDRVHGGYAFHDFHAYNPTKDQVASKREADRVRVAGKRAASREDVARDSLATPTRVASTRVPSQPIPTQESTACSPRAQVEHHPKSPLALRSERLRDGYLARFKRALPNVRPDACCHPMAGGPWLDLARELDDEHVDPLLDAFFADTDPFVAKDRAPGKIRSQRVRLLKARLPAVAPTIDTSDPVAVAEHAFNLAAEAAHASLKAGDDPETTQTLDRAEEAARQALRAAKANAANGARA